MLYDFIFKCYVYFHFTFMYVSNIICIVFWEMSSVNFLLKNYNLLDYKDATNKQQQKTNQTIKHTNYF